MKITVLYGSARRKTSYRAAQIFLEAMQQEHPVDVEEFYLYHDAPHLCRGCFQCFNRGERHCPHYQTIGPIVESMDQADGLLLVTPVYALQLSGAMKAFFDHLAYCYINHRPRFYRKRAMVIATTAGAGTSGTLKYIKKNLQFWGVNDVDTLGIRAQAMSWEDMEEKARNKAEQVLRDRGRQFAKTLGTDRFHAPTWGQVMMFSAGKVLMGLFPPDHPDRRYWEEKGWTDPDTRIFCTDIPVGAGKRLGGKLGESLMRRFWKPVEHGPRPE